MHISLDQMKPNDPCGAIKLVLNRIYIIGKEQVIYGYKDM